MPKDLDWNEFILHKLRLIVWDLVSLSYRYYIYLYTYVINYKNLLSVTYLMMCDILILGGTLLTERVGAHTPILFPFQDLNK